MRISLIGMAGAGKSYWARKLEEHGFTRFCCDEMIARRLAPELDRMGPGRKSVADWMGFPHEARYKERERRYLELEQEVVKEIVLYLDREAREDKCDVVVDTTGSFMYIDEKVIQRLRDLTLVVLLATPEEIQQKLLNDYIRNPHPMVWRDIFEKRPDETPMEAMARCYPTLFASRKAVYEKYAHICLDYYELRKEGFGPMEFLEKIRSVRCPGIKGKYWG